MGEVTFDELRDYEPGCRIIVPTVYATGPVVGDYLGILPADDYATKGRQRHPAIVVRSGDVVSYLRASPDIPKGATIHIDKRSAKRRRG